VGPTVKRLQHGLRRRTDRVALLRRLPKRGLGVEVGVWEGDFSSQLLRWNKPKQLHLVDPWRYIDADGYERAVFGGGRISGYGASDQAGMDDLHRGVVARFAPQCAAGQVAIHRMPSAEAAAELVTFPFDSAYIDGDHTYQAVKTDLENFWALVKPGGVLAGDDYGVKGWWNDGVTQAVDEFVAAHDAAVEHFGAQFLIRKPGLSI
jgi:hypothetical protein